MRRVVLSLVSWLIAPEIALAQEVGSAEPPGIRSIPGVTGADTHPEACVSCHIRMDDIGLDARLSTALVEWQRAVPEKVMEVAEGLMASPDALERRHPPVTLPLEAVPSSCIHCHNAASTAPPFAPLVHLVHYRGGENNHYLSVFGGECTLCHKLDWATGIWRVPSGPEK